MYLFAALWNEPGSNCLYLCGVHLYIVCGMSPRTPLTRLILKYHRSIGQTKRYNQILIMPGGGVESRFPLVALLDVDQVIGVAEVQIGKDLIILQEFKGRGEERQRIAILNCNVIKATVINAWTETPVLLTNEEEISLV